MAQLEQQLAEDGDGASAGSVDRRLTQLIRKKDGEIEERHAQLQAKAAEARKAADELAAKNAELLNSMAALRLYQLMFENDPNGLLGLSPEGLIVQFNSSAIRFFGYDLHKLRMQSIANLCLPGNEVDFKAIFDRAMETGAAEQVECRLQDRRIRLSCFRMEDIRGQRGAVFRISEIPEK